MGVEDQGCAKVGLPHPNAWLSGTLEIAAGHSDDSRVGGEMNRNHTDEGQFGGYSYRVFLPQDFYERFKVFRQENGLTGEKFWDEVLVICAERSRIEDMS